MNDKLSERFAPVRRPEPHIVSVTGQEEGDTHDLGYFGVLRGTAERSVMLELRKCDGNIMAIGYAWLERIEFDPSEGIRLFAAHLEVVIAGRNLNREVRPNLRLFEALARHRVPWLREADEGEAMEAPQQATVIESIGWKSRTK
jgi:hypothetical protein